MTEYVVLLEDDQLEHVSVMYATEQFMKTAAEGKLPHIKYLWKLRDAEKKAIKEGWHHEFRHNPDDLAAAVWASENDNVGPLTEEQAIEYLILKDCDESIWGNYHNMQRFRVVKRSDLPETREFRNAWKMVQSSTELVE